MIPTFWDFFLPNLTGNTLTGIILIGIGIVIAILSATYLSFIPPLSKLGVGAGLILTIVGLFMMFALSWYQNILKSQELTLIAIGIIFLIGLGIYLSYEQKRRR